MTEAVDRHLSTVVKGHSTGVFSAAPYFDVPNTSLNQNSTDDYA